MMVVHSFIHLVIRSSLSFFSPREVPRLVEIANRALEDGKHCVVIGLQSTGEANTKREVARRETATAAAAAAGGGAAAAAACGGGGGGGGGGGEGGGDEAWGKWFCGVCFVTCARAARMPLPAGRNDAHRAVVSANGCVCVCARVARVGKTTCSRRR